jgi:hypothetical protein
MRSVSHCGYLHRRFRIQLRGDIHTHTHTHNNNNTGEGETKHNKEETGAGQGRCKALSCVQCNTDPERKTQSLDSKYQHQKILIAVKKKIE